MALEAYDKVGVTGGSGFVGRHLIKRLVTADREAESPLEVVSLDLQEPGGHGLPDGVSFEQLDICDAVQVERVLSEGAYDLIFHVAANPNGTLSILDRDFDHQTNEEGTYNVVNAAANLGVRRLVYVSSASVYGRPLHPPMSEEHPLEPFVPYGASKLQGEIFTLMMGRSDNTPMETVAGRPFCIYGPGASPDELVEPGRYMRWALRDGVVPIVGDPDEKTRDFVYVEKVAEALVLLADRGENGEAYNIGSGEETSMRTLVETIGRVIGRELEIREIPGITNDTYRLTADISKLRNLGYEPHTNMEENLRSVAEYLGPHPAAPKWGTIFSPDQEGKAEDSVTEAA